ncbi:MAG: hypothetical protein O9284_18380 [Steroidobacteraceae bacterium]|nr:hypothetical protein [Steroidobacteraceae bacterium]
MEWLPEESAQPLPEEFAELGPALDAILAQVGGPFASLERRLDDAGWFAERPAETPPIPPGHKQHCLELDDPVERLRFLRPLFEIRRSQRRPGSPISLSMHSRRNEPRGGRRLFGRPQRR